MSKLVCIGGLNKGDEFPLHEGVNTIGRANDNTIALFDKKCSRLHAQIIKRGTYYVVEDQGSRNHTSVNGRVIDKKATLNEGDQIHVGKTLLVLSEKPQGGIIEQTIVNATADLQSNHFDKLVGAAAFEVGRNHASDNTQSGGLYGLIKRLFRRH